MRQRPQPALPRRLPALENDGTDTYITNTNRSALYAKYGDLTGAGLVAPRVRNAAAVVGETSDRRLAAVQPARDDSEYVTRREMEDRLSQLEQRITLLANAMRQQDEVMVKTLRQLDEVVAKTAALPLPRAGAPGSLPGIIGMENASVVDAGAMAVPDPTLGGGTGAGGPMFGAPFGTAHGTLLGAGGGGGLDGDDEDEGEEEDTALVIDDDEFDDHAGAEANAGLEALAGMEPVRQEDVPQGVGEAGTVTVPGRGMKQVALQMRYRDPVVIACLVPMRPSSADSSLLHGRGGEGGASFKQAPSTQSTVCVPFKDGTSFTVQLAPPAGADQMVSYVVLEAGPHTLEGGVRLIAGETPLMV